MSQRTRILAACLVVAVTACITYSLSGHAKGTLAPVALLEKLQGLSGSFSTAPPALTFEPLPTDPAGIAELVKRLATTCFETPEEEQPFSRVRLQLYRHVLPIVVRLHEHACRCQNPCVATAG